MNSGSSRRIEAEIFISAQGWDDLDSVSAEIRQELRAARRADENLRWQSSGLRAHAEMTIKIQGKDKDNG
jgi:hypothetical protein